MRGPFNSVCGCFSSITFLAGTLAVVSLAQTASLNNEGSRELNLGLSLLHAGKLDEAIVPLQQAAKDPATSAQAHFLLGADYFEARKYNKAISELRDLDDKARGDRGLYMIEESYRLSAQKAEARAAFLLMARQYPDSAWMHFLMGAAYEDQQLSEKAIDEYEQALKKDAAMPNVHFVIGYLYWRQQDFERARSWLGAEAKERCHALANFYLGEIAREERQFSEAERFYRRALVCDPAQTDGHLRLGVVLGDEKRFREAIGELKQAAALEPGKSQPHYRLAEVYKQMGRSAEAEAEFSKVRQLQAAEKKQ